MRNSPVGSLRTKCTGYIEVNDTGCLYRGNQPGFGGVLSTLHHFAGVLDLLDKLELAVSFAVQIRVIDRRFLPIGLLRKPNSLDFYEVGRITDCFTVHVRPCQEISKLKIGKLWVSNNE